MHDNSLKIALSSCLERTDNSNPERPPKYQLQNRLNCDFWNTKLFLLIHKAQHIAAKPIITRLLCLVEKLLNQGQKRCSTPSVLTLNIKHTLPHVCWAIGQLKKRCWIISCSAQKQHFVHPFQCLLTKLSLVNTTPFLRYQRKILIFKRILAFHAQQLTGVPSLKTMSLYIFFTEKILLAVQMKASLRSLRFTIWTFPTSSSHLSQMSPTKARLKDTFSGVVPSTWATNIFFFLTIL
jgi:hypothetical protein